MYETVDDEIWVFPPELVEVPALGEAGRTWAITVQDSKMDPLDWDEIHDSAVWDRVRRTTRLRSLGRPTSMSCWHSGVCTEPELSDRRLGSVPSRRGVVCTSAADRAAESSYVGSDVRLRHRRTHPMARRPPGSSDDGEPVASPLVQQRALDFSGPSRPRCKASRSRRAGRRPQVLLRMGAHRTSARPCSLSSLSAAFLRA